MPGLVLGGRKSTGGGLRGTVAGCQTSSSDGVTRFSQYDDAENWSDGESSDTPLMQSSCAETESEDDVSSTYVQVLQIRQGRYSNHSMRYKSFHKCTLTADGSNALTDTVQGRLALQTLAAEKRTLVERGAKPIAQKYKSSDLIEPLLKSCDAAVLYPILAKSDRVLLRFNFVIKFPNRKDDETPSPAAVHGSGLPAAIRNFFHQVASHVAMGAFGFQQSPLIGSLILLTLCYDRWVESRVTRHTSRRRSSPRNRQLLPPECAALEVRLGLILR